MGPGKWYGPEAHLSKPNACGKEFESIFIGNNEGDSGSGTHEDTERKELLVGPTPADVG